MAIRSDCNDKYRQVATQRPPTKTQRVRVRELPRSWFPYAFLLTLAVRPYAVPSHASLSLGPLCQLHRDLRLRRAAARDEEALLHLQLIPTREETMPKNRTSRGEQTGGKYPIAAVLVIIIVIAGLDIVESPIARYIFSDCVLAMC